MPRQIEPVFVPRGVSKFDVYENEWPETPQIRQEKHENQRNQKFGNQTCSAMLRESSGKKVRFECVNELDLEAESLDRKEPILSDKELLDNVVNLLLDRPNWKNFSVGDHASLRVSYILRICELVKPILIDQGALLKLGKENQQFKIFGDIHGQYDDLVQLLSIASAERSFSNKYLFLGDYVDRGENSFEVIVSLLVWKILCPNEVYLLRGNHEIASINRKYGFFDELTVMYDFNVAEEVFDAINDVFDCFPLAAILMNQFFCVHGGLSQNLKDAEDIAKVTLPCTVPEQGTLINDILWSDPDVNDEVKYWKPNSKRAAMYGSEAVRVFLEKNDLKGIIRAHQVAEKGYWTACENQVLCVFSAANYCGQQNLSAILTVRAKKMFIAQFQKDFNGTLSQINPERSREDSQGSEESNEDSSSSRDQDDENQISDKN